MGEVTVPDTALFFPELMLPLLPLLPLPSAATAPPPPLEPTSLTATLPPATTGRTLLEQSTLPTTMCTPDSLETTLPSVCLDTPMLLSPVSARGRLKPQLRTWIRIRIRRPRRHRSFHRLSRRVPPPGLCSGLRLRPWLLWLLIATSALV